MMSELYPSFPLFPHSREGGNLFLLALSSHLGDKLFLLACQGRRSASPTGIVQNVVGGGLESFHFLWGQKVIASAMIYLLLKNILY